MSKKKSNKLDLESSGLKNKMGVGQVILGFVLLLYTIVCAAPVLLVFIAAFTDEKYITQHGFSFLYRPCRSSGVY